MDKTACIVGAGEFTDRGIREPFELLIAADGGLTALEKTGLSPDVIVGDVTERERNQGIGVSQYHDLPEAIRAKNERRRKKHSGKNPLSENEAASKAKDAMAKLRKPGRPKGSRNRKTIEREKEAALKGTAEQPVKRGPGRPRGRKNNSTLAREASMSAVNVAPSEKRRRGRPAGSKDKIQRIRRTKKELIAEREKQQS